MSDREQQLQAQIDWLQQELVKLKHSEQFLSQNAERCGRAAMDALRERDSARRTIYAMVDACPSGCNAYGDEPKACKVCKIPFSDLFGLELDEPNA